MLLVTENAHLHFGSWNVFQPDKQNRIVDTITIMKLQLYPEYFQKLFYTPAHLLYYTQLVLIHNTTKYIRG
jgi:hypothetical protein